MKPHIKKDPRGWRCYPYKGASFYFFGHTLSDAYMEYSGKPEAKPVGFIGVMRMMLGFT